ncbi:MAG: adenine phosphoribosyltransferase, partial [Myxococcota bacterium]
MESLRQAQIQFLQKHIRDIPDFPKPGILFKDITPLLAHYEAFHQTIDLFAKHYRPMNVDKIIGIESRG